MTKQNLKRLFSAGLVIPMLVALIAILPVQTLAATTLTSPATNLTATIDGSSGAFSGTGGSGTVSMTVKGGTYLSKNGTLTLTNSGSEAARLSFSYAVSGTGYNTFTVAGSAGSSSGGTYEAELAAGSSVAIYLACPKKVSITVTLTNVKLEVASSANVTISHNSFGSVSVSGTTITSGDTVEVDAAGATFAATPASGATFVGWINTADNSVVSTSASFTYIPTSDASVTAVFTKSSEEAWFLTAGKSYLVQGLDAAITSASNASGKVIILAASGTLSSGTYTIPSGVTLLAPFDDAGTLYTTSPDYVEDSYTTPSAFRTLTLANGANITVQSGGAISVSAKVSAKMGYAGAPTSKYGHIALNSGSSITVQSGGNLYAWGYITGSGTVTLESGATAYESFQVVDWRGGTASSGMLGNEKKVFLMSQYYVQNVEAPMVITSGAAVTCSMIADIISVRQVTVQFFGSSGCIFNLTSGSVTKSYDGSTDRLVLDVNGAFSISSTTIELIQYVYSITLSDYVLPINNNVTINVNGTLTLNQDTSLLPGTQLNIAEGGTVTLASGKRLFVYDREEWFGEDPYVYINANNVYFRPVVYAHSRTYNRSAADLIDAQVLINGTLDASAGYLYTTASGGNICSTGSGIVKMQAAEASPTLYEATQGDPDDDAAIDYASIAITPAQLLNSNGSYTVTGSSATTPNTYTYTDGRWTCATHTDGEVAVENNEAPSCTESGSYDNVTYCAVCGTETSRETVTVPAAHTEVVDAAVAATCTATGLTEGKHCSACGEVTVAQTVVAATGHSYTAAVTAPTCTAQGYTTYTCPTCGDSYVADYVDAAGHTEVTDAAVDATCTTTGLTEGKHCSVCNEVTVAQTVVAALGHTEVTVAGKAATCTDTGLTEGKKCSVCGEVTVAQEVIPATGHLNTTTTTVAATCKAEGSETVTCDDCGATVSTKTLEKLAHTEVTDAAVAATCTATGLTEGKHCSVCGEVTVAQTVTEVLGHEYDSGVVTTEPSCNAAGVKTYTCQREGCGSSYTEAIEATGHTPVTDAAVDATCTTSGLTEGSHCSVCNTVLTAQTEVPALGHSYDDGVVTTEPSCNAAGVKTYTCSVCGEEKTESIDATGHDWTNKDGICRNCDEVCGHEDKFGEDHICTVCGYECTHARYEDGKCSLCGYGCEHVWDDGKVNAPTCTEDGYTVYTCSICKIVENRNQVTATGHSYESVVTAPTCTAGGYTTYTCACGDTYTADETQAKGHSYNSVVTPPTCTADGYTTHTCANCGDAYKDSAVAALGHSYESVVTPPTCTTDGYTTYTCSTCGDTYTADETAATGHTPGTTVVENNVAPSCTATGSYDNVVYCTACDAELSRETVTVDKIEHSYEALVTAPTCTSGGYTTYTCSVCGDTYTGNETSATGHSYGDWVTVSTATCENPGSQRRDCESCDAYETQTLPATGHSYEAVVTAPTFEADGYTTYTCHCGDTYTVTDEGSKLTAVAQIGDTKYQTLPEAVGQAAEGDTVLLLADVALDSLLDATGVTIDLNGHTLTGTVFGTLSMNGGTLITAEGYKMAGPQAEYYETEDAVFTIFAPAEGQDLGDITVLFGTLTVVPEIWWTGEGQTLTIAEDATFVIPQGVTMHVLSTVVVEGTVTIQGTVNLYSANAVIQAEEGLNITTTAGDAVLYADGRYTVHDHTEAAAVVKNEIPATCTATGSYDNVVYCSVCDAELSRTTVAVPALGHDEVSHEAKAPTCTEIGWDTYVTCSRCDYSTYAEKSALGHSYSSVVTAPTCTEKGYTTYTCACGDTYTADETEAKGHSWSQVSYVWSGLDDNETGLAPVSEAEVTCTASRSCACGESETAAAQIGSEITTPATCTAMGTTTYTASFEAEWATDGQTATRQDVAVIPHTYDQQVVSDTYKATDATCTDPATYYYSCSCGAKGTKTFENGDKLGHTSAEAVEENRKEATCGEAGSYESVVNCSVCKAELSRTTVTIPATGEHSYDNDCDTDCNVCGTTREITHDWNEGEITTEATCTEPGVRTYTCSVCQATKTEAIEATNHSIVTVEAKAATCVDAGWEAYEYCTNCDYTTRGEDIPATGEHRWSEGTCTACGEVCEHSYADGVCEVCGMSEPVVEIFSSTVKHGVLYKDKIQIQYFFTLNNADTNATKYGALIWTVEEYNEEIDLFSEAKENHLMYTSETVYDVELIDTTSGLGAYNEGQKPRELHQEYYAVPYAVIDGSYHYGNADLYSVQQYADDILTKSANEKSRKAVEEMMRFAKFTQLYLAEQNNLTVDVSVFDAVLQKHGLSTDVDWTEDDDTLIPGQIAFDQPEYSTNFSGWAGTSLLMKDETILCFVSKGKIDDNIEVLYWNAESFNSNKDNLIKGTETGVLEVNAYDTSRDQGLARVQSVRLTDTAYYVRLYNTETGEYSEVKADSITTNLARMVNAYLNNSSKINSLNFARAYLKYAAAVKAYLPN